MSFTSPTRQSQEKRQHIHQAAQALFMQHGFEGTSMDTIAVTAQVSKPTLYRYYQSKEALFIAVLQDLALHHPAEQTLHDVQNQPIDSLATLEQALVVWAQATLTNVMQPSYLGLLRLLIAELPRFPSLGMLFMSAVPQQGGAYLMTLLESARSHGVLAVDDLEPATRLLAGPLLTYIFGNGLFASGNEPYLPSSAQVATLIHLAVQAIAHQKP